MKNASQKKTVNPVLNMLFLGLCLVVLVGVWSVISYLAFPDAGGKDTYRELVAANEPLLTQAAQNVLDPEQWPGIQSTAEVQALFEKGKFTGAYAEDGQARFVIATENVSADLSTCLVYCPDGSFTLADGVWRAAVVEGGSTRYEDPENAGRYVAVQQLSEHFYLVEACLPA